MREHPGLFLIAELCFCSFLVLSAQVSDNEAQTRNVWDLSLQKQRRQASAPPSVPLPAKSSDNAFIGITVWRLRPSQPGDAPSVRMLIQDDDGGKDQEWTPERCDATIGLRVGQKVRVSVESWREGYLYIIDREQYSDGTFGQAQLIFPTLRTLHGNNRVRAGRVVDIPGAGEGPFRVERRRQDQLAEEITILVTPEPMDDLHIGPKPLSINKDQLAEWKKNWGAAVKHLEEPGQAGKVSTPAEKDAAEKGNLLTDSDPLPQTLFHVNSGAGKPMLVTMLLKIE